MLRLSLFLLALAVASVAVGAGGFLFAEGADPDLLAVSRLPRTVAAILTGAGLAIAGLIMQTLARNRFVDPMVAGGGQSAALGILIATLVAPGAAIAVKMIASTVAALAGSALFLAMAHRLPARDPYLLPLVGIVFGGVIGALATAIAWRADLIQFLEIWMSGEFSGVMQGRYELLWLSAVFMALAWWAADRLTIFSLGREASISLGLNYRNTRRLGLVVVAVIAGSSVVTVGILPFVGLIAPALISEWKGDDVRRAIPLVGLTGAILVLLSDLLGRLIIHPYEVPAAVVLGVVGAVFFLLILLRRTPRHA